MAEQVDRGKVDWESLVEDAIQAAALTYGQPFAGSAMDLWLRTTFEPLVKAAEAMRIAAANGVLPRDAHIKALRAALDHLPKVGG